MLLGSPEPEKISMIYLFSEVPVQNSTKGTTFRIINKQHENTKNGNIFGLIYLALSILITCVFPQQNMKHIKVVVVWVTICHAVCSALKVITKMGFDQNPDTNKIIVLLHPGLKYITVLVLLLIKRSVKQNVLYKTKCVIFQVQHFTYDLFLYSGSLLPLRQVASLLDIF